MAEEKNYITGLPRSKSLNFLYPLVGLKKNIQHKIGSYLFWKDEGIENLKLIVKYKNLGKDFDSYEEETILRNEKIDSCYKVEDGMVYIFDMASWADDIFEFLEGRYSKMSGEAKGKILEYHGIDDLKTVKPGRYVFMTLFPEKFFKVCAEELGMTEEDLRVSGELLGKYSKELETLEAEIELDCECVEPKILTL